MKKKLTYSEVLTTHKFTVDICKEVTSHESGKDEVTTNLLIKVGNTYASFKDEEIQLLIDKIQEAVNAVNEAKA